MFRASRLLLVGWLGLTACATVGGLRSEPLDRGVARRFAVPFDSVIAVSLKSAPFLSVSNNFIACERFSLISFGVGVSDRGIKKTS